MDARHVEISVLSHLLEKLAHGIDRRPRDEAQRSLVEVPALCQRRVERPGHERHALGLSSHPPAFVEQQRHL